VSTEPGKPAPAGAAGEPGEGLPETAVATEAPTLIVAARNEAERIAATLEALAATFPRGRLIVADDASTDSTARIARERGALVIAGERSRGKGANVTAAAEAALAGEGLRTFLLCDADLGASAGRLKALVRAVESGECELAVAAFSRRVGGGLGLARGYAARAIERLCGLGTRAPISGQRAMTEVVLRDCLPFAAGFGMELGMTVDAVRAGHRVAEIEIDLEHRATGRTPGGFLHRARQLRDMRRAARARRRAG